VVRGELAEARRPKPNFTAFPPRAHIDLADGPITCMNSATRRVKSTCTIEYNRYLPGTREWLPPSVLAQAEQLGEYRRIVSTIRAGVAAIL